MPGQYTADVTSVSFRFAILGTDCFTAANKRCIDRTNSFCLAGGGVSGMKPGSLGPVVWDCRGKNTSRGNLIPVSLCLHCRHAWDRSCISQRRKISSITISIYMGIISDITLIDNDTHQLYQRGTSVSWFGSTRTVRESKKRRKNHLSARIRIAAGFGQ